MCNTHPYRFIHRHTPYTYNRYVHQTPMHSEHSVELASLPSEDIVVIVSCLSSYICQDRC